MDCDTVRDCGSADKKTDCDTVADVLTAAGGAMSKSREGMCAEPGIFAGFTGKIPQVSYIASIKDLIVNNMK